MAMSDFSLDVTDRLSYGAYDETTVEILFSSGSSTHVAVYLGPFDAA